MKKLCLIIGRGASGKSTLARKTAKDLNLKIVRSYTTRPPRNKQEKSGISDHYFISADDVLKFKDKIVAYTEINGYEYFTTTDELDSCDLYVIDPNGVEYLKAAAGDRYDLVTVYVNVPADIAKERARLRGDNMEIFRRRRQDENEQFSDFEKNKAWDYCIVNDGNLEDSVKELEWILQKEFV